MGALTKPKSNTRISLYCQQLMGFLVQEPNHRAGGRAERNITRRKEQDPY